MCVCERGEVHAWMGQNVLICNVSQICGSLPEQGAVKSAHELRRLAEPSQRTKGDFPRLI